MEQFWTRGDSRYREGTWWWNLSIGCKLVWFAGLELGAGWEQLAPGFMHLTRIVICDVHVSRRQDENKPHELRTFPVCSVPNDDMFGVEPARDLRIPGSLAHINLAHGQTENTLLLQMANKD